MPAPAARSQWHIAECLVPGLTERRAEVLSQRLRAELARSAGCQVLFIGSLLMPEDEVLLCLFAGSRAEVREVSERAGLPFERILGCVAFGWRADQQPAIHD